MWRPWVIRGWTAEGALQRVTVKRGGKTSRVSAPLQQARASHARAIHESALLARVPVPGGALPVNRMPYVAFHDDDVPWRLSSVVGGEPLRPWLALIVVPEAGAGLEVDEHGARWATIDSAWLPSHDTLRRSAHAVDGGPSRLLCATPLVEGKTYRALLVPTTTDSGSLAWADGETKLRVLMTWTFHTVGARDFADDVAQLAPAQLAELGWRKVAVDGERHAWCPGAVVRGEQPYGPDLADIEAQILGKIWPKIDGVIQPPIRGEQVREPVSDPLTPWFRELNVRPTGRMVAAAGEALVRSQQEALVAEVVAGQGAGGARNGLRSSERGLSAGGRRRARTARAASVPSVRKRLASARLTLDDLSDMGRESGSLGFERLVRTRPPAGLSWRSRTRRVARAATVSKSVFELAVEHAPEVVLPGLSKLALDEFAWLAPSAAFADAYWTGVNEELARELRWRELPEPAGAAIPSFWPGARYTPGDAAPNTSFLVLRSGIWAAFPSLWVGLYPKGANGEPVDGGEWITPLRTLVVNEDTRLVQWPVAKEIAEAAFLVFAQDPDGVGFQRVEDAGDAVSFATEALERPLEVWLG